MHDVAIAGAGPAGAWLARELARERHSVVLLERSPTAGEPNSSSAASPLATVERFDLPRESVAARWDIGKLYGPRSAAVWHFPQPVGVVFDFRQLKSLLVTQAREAGATVLLGKPVAGVVSGSAVTQGGERFPARVIVDASGPAGVLATQLGLKKQARDAWSAGVERICEIEAIPPDQQRTAQFHFGRMWAPHGYGWVFPMGGSKVKIGICAWRLARHGLKIELVLDRFVARFPWLAGARVLEQHGGIGYLSGGIRRHASENVIVIGDAADQLNPLAGEGIRHAFQSARYAAAAIRNALASRDCRALQACDPLWESYTGRRWRVCALIAGALYAHSPDALVEILVRQMAKLNPQEALDVAFEYRAAPLLHGFFRHCAGPASGVDF